MQIVSNGDNLHEISNPVFMENKRNIINLSSAEFVWRVVIVMDVIFCSGDRVNLGVSRRRG